MLIFINKTLLAINLMIGGTQAQTLVKRILALKIPKTFLKFEEGNMGHKLKWDENII